MAAHFWIHDGVDWVEITNRVNLTNVVVLSEKAEEGATAISTLIVDDPAMDLEIDPFTPFVATEDTSESDDTVWASGWLAGRRVGRVNGGLRNPTGRFWACELVDENNRWHRRVLKASDANRDAETDNERSAWLLQQMQDWGLIDDDTTYVSSAAASGNDDAEDFRLRYPDEVMGDAAEAKSKNWWIQRQGAMGSFVDVAWWGIDGNTLYSSPLYLTNDLAEIGPRVNSIAEGTSDVWPLRMDHGLRCIPERMYSGVGGRHRAGTFYRHDSVTAAIIGRRDVVMSGTEQKTKTVAVNRALRYLDDLGAEEFRVEARVRLPAAKVTKLRAGMRVPVAMTHWPFGLDAWTWWRVVSWSGGPAPAGPWYDVDLELASTGDAASAPLTEPHVTAGGTIHAGSGGWFGSPGAYHPLFFEGTGDVPYAGYPATPVLDTDLFSYHTNAEGYDGFEAVVAMTGVSFRLITGFTTTLDGGDTAVSTCEIRVNNVAVESVVDVYGPVGGAGGHGISYDFTADDLTLAAGDVVTAYLNVIITGSVGQRQWLVVRGGFSDRFDIVAGTVYVGG